MTSTAPKIRSVVPSEEHILVVTFDNAVRKSYDVHRLMEHEMFAPLRHTALFTNVRVEPGGYAVSWGPDIDISEYELWQHGIETGGGLAPETGGDRPRITLDRLTASDPHR
jgi:hypothetical protein